MRNFKFWRRGLVLLLLLFVDRATLADSTPGAGRFGGGVMIGTITSFTGNYWINDRASLDFGIGIDSDPGTELYADYLWHFPQLFGTSSPFGRETSAYIGGGPGIGFWSRSVFCTRWGCSSSNGTTEFFIRGLVGAEWHPRQPPIGVFFELGPSIAISPGSGGTVDVGLGIRYYF